MKIKPEGLDFLEFRENLILFLIFTQDFFQVNVILSNPYTNILFFFLNMYAEIYFYTYISDKSKLRIYFY